MSKRKMEEFLNDLGVNENLTTDQIEPVEEVFDEETVEEEDYEDYLDNDLGSFYDDYNDDEANEFEEKHEEAEVYDDSDEVEEESEEAEYQYGDDDDDWTDDTVDPDSLIAGFVDFALEFKKAYSDKKPESSDGVEEDVEIEYEDDYVGETVAEEEPEVEVTESEEDLEDEEKWIEDNPDNHITEQYVGELHQKIDNEISEEIPTPESIRHVLLKNGESEEENKKEMSTEQMVLQNNREILGGINMENYKSLTNMTLSNGQTKELVKTINGENLRDIISGKILHTVSFIKMPRAEFFEKFLATNMELSDAEKNELMQEYYPSALSGSAVEHIMAVDVDENVITPNKALGEGASPIFWRSSGADLRSYTSKYPEIFGSKVMIPALEIKTPLGETKYRIFISTLHAVLYAEGVTIQEIRDYKYKVSVTNVLTANGQLRTQGTKDPIQTGLNNGSVRIAEDYLIKYSRL